MLRVQAQCLATQAFSIWNRRHILATVRVTMHHLKCPVSSSSTIRVRRSKQMHKAPMATLSHASTRWSIYPTPSRSVRIYLANNRMLTSCLTRLISLTCSMEGLRATHLAQRRTALSPPSTQSSWATSSYRTGAQFKKSSTTRHPVLVSKTLTQARGMAISVSTRFVESKKTSEAKEL